MSRKNQFGMTISETIVLVLVAAIVAALLFPVFAKARQERFQRSCQSNEKQIGRVIQQYAEDWDGCCPFGTQSSLVNGSSLAYGKMERAGVGWGGQLYEYAKSPSLYVCPSDPTLDSPHSHGALSYALNAKSP